MGFANILLDELPFDVHDSSDASFDNFEALQNIVAISDQLRDGGEFENFVGDDLDILNDIINDPKNFGLKVGDRPIQGDPIADPTNLIGLGLGKATLGLAVRVGSKSVLSPGALSGLSNTLRNLTLEAPTLSGFAAKAGSVRTFAASGFKNSEDFISFGQGIRAALSNIGFGNTTPILQGSAVTGRAFLKGQVPFDKGLKLSDFDIALAGDDIFTAAKNAGIPLRGKGTRTGVIQTKQLEALGLTDLAKAASLQAGREVNFVIFNSAENAVNRAPSIIFPK